MQDYYYYSDSEEQHKYYSRSDFRDQYCISERNLTAALERSKSTNYLFSCIGSYEGVGGTAPRSPCKSGSNPFTSCYSGRRGRRYYEEEEEERRTRRREGRGRDHHHFHPHYSSDGEGGFTSTQRYSQHYIKRPPQRYYDRKYIWNEELERYIECSSRKLTRYTSVPLQRSSKHVSFDQDHGGTGKWGGVCGAVGSTSLERLIEYGPPPLQPPPPRSITPQLYRSSTPLPFIHRTQSTQTEESPIKQSSAAQTNGLQQVQVQRKLEKTYSDGEILLERRKALKTSFQDVQLQKPNREPYLFKYKIDDTFHEKLFEDGLLRDSFETSSRLQTSEDEESSIGSSSAGSYLLNNLPPLPPSPNGIIEEVRISPPEDFADNGKTRKKRSFRSKSEETSGEESRPTHYRSWHGDLDSIGGTLELEGFSLNNYGNNFICISELQESLVWRTHAASIVPLNDLSTGELEFYKRFTATTHRLVHRKASAEVYRRMGENRLEITHRTTVHRSANNEFGFRIHGSRPVVVSAVERSTPADVAGLRVGDVLISLNGVQVLDSSHSHVVQIANVDLLEMELCSTSLYFEWENEDGHGWEGAAWRRCDNDNGAGRWGRRHLHLTPTSIQVYYTTDYNTLIDILPIHLDTKLLTSFILESIVVYPLSYGGGMLAFESVDERAGFLRGVRELGGRGREKGRREVQPTTTHFPQLSTPYTVLSLLRSPDTVLGPLHHFSRATKSWSRYDCVLHKCVLYFYNNPSEEQALGAVFLHGYKVVISNTTVGGRRWIFQLQQSQGGRLSGGRQGLRDYFFAVEGETERKRWLAALEYSIDRWLSVGVGTGPTAAAE